MTRRDGSHDDRDLDDLIRRVRENYLARQDRSFDFEQGMTDVRVRAATQGQATAARHDETDSPVVVAAADACDDIDRFIEQLGWVLLAQPVRDLAGGQLQQAAEHLLLARDLLSRQSLQAATAASIFATARNALGQAALSTPGRTDFHADQLGAALADLEREVSLVLTLSGAGGQGHPSSASGEGRRRQGKPPPDQRRARGGA